MLGETTFGTYVMYGALILLLVVMVVMVVRVLAWLSLLFIDPIAEILRQIPGLRRLVPAKAPETKNAREETPPGDL